MKALLTIDAQDSEGEARARIFAAENNLLLSDVRNSDFVLEFSLSGVRLLDLRSGKPIEVRVDFTAGATVHRMKYGGGKSQLIAKAVGITAHNKPRILDATAGLGKDAFVFAGLGSEVILLERSAIAFALLDDGLLRARYFVDENRDDEYEQLRETIKRMSLVNTDSHEYLKSLKPEFVNVVYLDPMFPERKKSAQVKKEMQAFQELVGKDEDADELLELAFAIAENRVVVKRPNQAPFLGNREPTYQLKGKTSRFDVYAKKKFE